MSDPVFILDKVNAYYGRAHILHDVSFELGAEPVAVIGRNGMGKTTLCLAIMGLMAHADGSVRFAGRSSWAGRRTRSPAPGSATCPRVAGSSRRSRRGASRHARARRGGRWTKDAIWELFPRLAERKRRRGPAFGRGAADARDLRARSSESRSSCSWTSRPRGSHRRSWRTSSRRARVWSRRGSGSCSSSRTSAWRRRSPSGSWSWSPVRSRRRRPPRRSSPTPTRSSATSASRASREAA